MPEQSLTSGMADQTDARGNKVPDTATTYERAKPEQESPSKTLSQPPTAPPHQQDELARNAEPSSQKKGQ